MQEKLRITEYTFFVLLNIIFSSSLLAAWIIGNISLFLTLKINSVDPINTSQDTDLLLWAVLVGIIFILLKLSLLPILYSLKKYLPGIHNFLDRFLLDKKFTVKVLSGAVFFDVLINLISVIPNSFNFKNTDEFLYEFFYGTLFADYFENVKTYFLFSLLFGGGIFICYLVFLFTDKLKQR